MGLQKDGDLWEQAWKAIVKRGPGNQDLRKFKGHATEKDVQTEKVSPIDKIGNDKSDEQADHGVESIGGRGLVKLGVWLAKRHDRYASFMKRVHKMIATITIAEKQERAKDKEIQRMLIGYDPEKWLKTNAQLRDDEQNQQVFNKLDMPPAIRGKHIYSRCQNLYGDIHAFFSKREWAPVQQDNSTSGTTWTELFVLYDTAGGRTEEGEHVKDPAANVRADKRRAMSKSSKAKRNKGPQQSAIAKPSMDEERKLFKAIVRQITRHEATPQQSK